MNTVCSRVVRALIDAAIGKRASLIWAYVQSPAPPSTHEIGGERGDSLLPGEVLGGAGVEDDTEGHERALRRAGDDLELAERLSVDWRVGGFRCADLLGRLLVVWEWRALRKR